jgi:predicted RNase H-like nuclease (RuvC/YqgF family)
MSYSTILKQKCNQPSQSTEQHLQSLSKQIDYLVAANQTLQERVNDLQQSLFSIELERQFDPATPTLEQERKYFDARIERDYNEVIEMVEKLERKALESNREREKRLEYLIRCVENLAGGNIPQVYRLLRFLRPKDLEIIRE